jgi:hypothetical protein
MVKAWIFALSTTALYQFLITYRLVSYMVNAEGCFHGARASGTWSWWHIPHSADGALLPRSLILFRGMLLWPRKDYTFHLIPCCLRHDSQSTNSLFAAGDRNLSEASQDLDSIEFRCLACNKFLGYDTAFEKHWCLLTDIFRYCSNEVRNALCFRPVIMSVNVKVNCYQYSTHLR